MPKVTLCGCRGIGEAVGWVLWNVVCCVSLVSFAMERTTREKVSFLRFIVATLDDGLRVASVRSSVEGLVVIGGNYPQENAVRAGCERESGTF
jgi:hypothetical protein